MSYIAAIEELLASVNGNDHVEERDIFGRPRQPDAASHTLGSDHDAGFIELGHHAGHEFDR